MAGNLTVTVNDAAAAAVADVQVLVYNSVTKATVGDVRTNASGVALFTALPDASYKVYAVPNNRTHPNQWAGGGYDWNTAPVWTTIAGGPVAKTLVLRDPISQEEKEEVYDRANLTFWKDTSNANAIVALRLGEERTRVFEDKFDPIYHHVLVGPFLTTAKAAAS